MVKEWATVVHWQQGGLYYVMAHRPVAGVAKLEQLVALIY